MRVLLERERELAEFDAAIGEVGAGRGCAVAVEAAAGLGKTRLLQEARAAAGAEFEVLAARATELEQDFPFALVRQLFESRLSTLSDGEREQVLEGAEAARGALGVDPEGEATSDSFAVLHGLYWVTAALAERKPLLLAIDDAHWADAVSLDYLGFLLPRLEELPVLLIVTCRPEEPEPSGGMQRILADPVVRHLMPAPLSAEATAALLAEELDRQPESPFAATCHEMSGGNPFLLGELARTLAEEEIEPAAEQAALLRELAPEQVTRTVLMRIERLAAEAGSLARSLAVLGDGSDTRLVAELAELDLDRAAGAADELRAGSIFDRAASLQFIHPLVRNGIYSEIPASERAQTHARAAALLRDRAASPEQVATQLLSTEGREDQVTVGTLIEVGERALNNGAPRSAIAYLTRALREPPRDGLRSAVLEPLITASFRTADYAAFAAIEADVFAELKRDPSLLSRWAIQLTMAMAMGGRFEEVAALIAEAVEVAVAEGSVERAFQLEAQLRTIAALVPSVPEVDLTRYADLIERDSPAGRLAAAMEARTAIVNVNAAEAVEAAKRALGQDAVIFAEEPELAAAVTSVMILIAADELDPARRAVERALEIAHDRDATPALAQAWNLSGLVAWAYGDLVAAEADLRQAIDLARLAGIGPLLVMFTGTFVEILIERDQLDAAEAELQAIGMVAGPVPETALFSTLLLTRGHLRLERGELESAAEDFERLAANAETMGFGPGPNVMASPFAARSLMAIGEHEQAGRLAEQSMGYARRWGSTATIGHAMRGVAAARGGAEGIEVLEEAAAMVENSNRPLEHAHVLAELGEALRREGRRVDARTPLREALAIARRCGAVRIAKRAREELQATGETVRRYAPIGVESLTPSERRVAELAASGMTNRQIAQSLFVTLKTVEAHLSAAYDKLDIGSRRQLGDALGASNRGAE
ncbi:MAG TPA: AAA family ATPase [Solirubrobacterales bacterium]|nr:AAA family ATPase [Solirubrobacterales bacterium]